MKKLTLCAILFTSLFAGGNAFANCETVWNAEKGVYETLCDTAPTSPGHCRTYWNAQTGQYQTICR